MAKPQVSFAKRQREQAKKEKKQMKAEKRAQKKNDDGTDVVDDPMMGELVTETPIE